MKKALLLVASIAGLLVLGYLLLPYGPSDFKAIKAVTLRAHITSWHNAQRPSGFGFTNENEQCYLLFRRLPAGATIVETVMALESSFLPRPGYLVGTDSSAIYWFDGKAAVPVR